MSRDSTIAFIPTRIGSTRLPKKNLALLDGRPLMAYAISAALESRVFDRVIVDGDHPAFGEVAARYGAEFYLREPDLGSSQTRSDDVVLDFIEHFPSTKVAWINSINPFQTPREIRSAVEYFNEESLDSLITVENRQVHSMLGDRPLNFEMSGKFALTQDLEPVQVFAYSLMMWRSKIFVDAMQDKGHAFFCGRFGTYPVSRLTSMVIKKPEDLTLADSIMRARRKSSSRLHYYSPRASSVGGI